MGDGSHFGGTRDPERVRWLAVADRERKEREDRKEELTALRARIAELEGEVGRLRCVEQTSGELCPACGWRGIRGDDGCAFCSFDAAGNPVGAEVLRLRQACLREQENTSNAELRVAELEGEVGRLTKERDEARKAADVWKVVGAGAVGAVSDQNDANDALLERLDAAIARAEAAEAREAGLSNAVAFLWAAYRSATADRAVLTHNECRLEGHLESVHAALNRVAGFDPLEAALAAPAPSVPCSNCERLDDHLRGCRDERDAALARATAAEAREAGLREAVRKYVAWSNGEGGDGDTLFDAMRVSVELLQAIAAAPAKGDDKP
jgi:hypothetical protein